MIDQPFGELLILASSYYVHICGSLDQTVFSRNISKTGAISFCSMPVLPKSGGKGSEWVRLHIAFVLMKKEANGVVFINAYYLISFVLLVPISSVLSSPQCSGISAVMHLLFLD